MDSITDLENTEYYSLSQLFSTSNRKIIIPDFQRDYCWGDATHGENNVDILSSFLETLKEEFLSFKELGTKTFLGKIDVYQNPKDQIYITDGQQRLTSLYLIIGILYKQKRIDKLRECLISKEEEENDDKEPYLNFAIRESSIFFLRDLVNEFFLKENISNVENIKAQNWFINEYNWDPTITSMLNALSIIEKNLKETDKFSLTEFAEFLINNVVIQYYDVIERRHGEERFVIINTTGQNLTVSENLKPILLGKIEDDKCLIEWEKRETWFWKRRAKDEQTADNGVNEFMTWCFQISEKQDSVDLVKDAKQLFKERNENKAKERINFLNVCFEALGKLVKLLVEDKIQLIFKSINDDKEVKDIIGLRRLSKERQQNILLPILAYLVKFNSNIEDVYSILRRLRKNYFDSVWKERNNNYIDWRYVLQIIDNSDDLVETLTFETTNVNIKPIQSVTLNLWYNEEEKWKDSYKINYEDKNSIEEIEDSKDFMGDLSSLLKVTKMTKDISILKDYFKSYIDFLSPVVELKNEISLLRICSDYFPNWFNLEGGFRCIEKTSHYRIFNKIWFDKIWRLFTLEKDSRFENIKKINKAILFSILREKNCTDALLFETNFLQESNISMELLNDFEKSRVEHWSWAEGYAIAAIYYWMFLENEFNNSQDLSIKGDNLRQIGFQKCSDIESDESRNYSYANIKVASHKPGGWYLIHNYELMKKIFEIQKDKEGANIDRINDILMKVKVKLLKLN